QFEAGQSVASLGLSGEERFDIVGLAELMRTGFRDGRLLRVNAISDDGRRKEFSACVRIDTPQEVLYYRHGGILQFVLRQLLGGRERPVALSPTKLAASPQTRPDHTATDRDVEIGSEESFPASDPPAY